MVYAWVVMVYNPSAVSEASYAVSVSLPQPSDNRIGSWQTGEGSKTTCPAPCTPYGRTYVHMHVLCRSGGGCPST